MIPILAGLMPRLTLGAILLAAAGLGVWYYGHTRFNAGEAKVWALWKAERDVAWRTYQEKETETARLENDLDLATWRIERELEPKLAAADATGKRIARELRDYYARRSAVSEAPFATADPFRTGGDGVDTSQTDADLGAVVSACQRDAVRLNGWIQWYEAIPPEMKR